MQSAGVMVGCVRYKCRNSTVSEKTVALVINEMEAAVVLEQVSDVEAVAATEVPSGACGGLVVDDDLATKGADGSGVVIEGVLKFPRLTGRGRW